MNRRRSTSLWSASACRLTGRRCAIRRTPTGPTTFKPICAVWMCCAHVAASHSFRSDRTPVCSCAATVEERVCWLVVWCVGEAGDRDHLLAAYLTANAISTHFYCLHISRLLTSLCCSAIFFVLFLCIDHGIELRKLPTLQYLFYLSQVRRIYIYICLCMRTCVQLLVVGVMLRCSFRLVWPCRRSATTRCLSTITRIRFTSFSSVDWTCRCRPTIHCNFISHASRWWKWDVLLLLMLLLLICSILLSPLFHCTICVHIQEYSVAAQVWKLSSVDLMEVARNSVLQCKIHICFFPFYFSYYCCIADFEPHFKRWWIGPYEHLPSARGNE